MTRRARILVTLTLLVPLLLLYGRTTKADTAGSPTAVVSETLRDLGSVSKGVTVETTFTIRNDGGAPLRLLEATPSCECLTVEIDSPVAPGEEGTVRVTLDAGDLLGPIQEAITVRTNDPEHEELELRIEAKVDPVVAALPGYARWIYVQQEPEGSLPQIVGSLDDEEFEILRIESPAPYIRTSVREATPEEQKKELSGSQWRVGLTLSRDAPVGALTGSVKIHTDHPVQELLEIPVSGFVRPIAHITPVEGHFGRLEITEPKKSVFSLTNFASAPMEIRGIEHDIEGLDAQARAVEEGRRFQIVLTFDPDKMPQGRFEDTLIIRTDNENLPTLELPVSGTLATPTDEGSTEGSAASGRL